MVSNMMKDMELKNPGCCWAQVNSEFHILLAGVNSHPQMSKIIEKLDELNIEMKKSLYFQDMDFVLQGVEEQDKEQMLCRHSEKLEVAFLLRNTLPGSPLLVVKNLRICSEFHVVRKLYIQICRWQYIYERQIGFITLRMEFALLGIIRVYVSVVCKAKLCGVKLFGFNNDAPRLITVVAPKDL